MGQREKMMRLADFLVEDIMAMTDQEILFEETETASQFASIIVDNPSYQLSPEFHGDRLALAKGFIAIRAQLRADGETIERLITEKNTAFSCLAEILHLDKDGTEVEWQAACDRAKEVLAERRSRAL